MQGLEEYWKVQKQKTMFVFEKMESRGVKIDQELCKRQIALGEIQMDEILEILGYDNLGPKALKELLLDKLGLPPIYKERKKSDGSVVETLTFDKDAMAEYETILERTEDPTAGYVLTYRGWQKTISSNYRAYLDLISPDGRLRPNYKLHGTRTGRVSCEKPNLQQIPRNTTKPWNGNLKSAFIEEDDFQLWESDYSQLELRLATAYANIDSLKQVFAEGRDIFTEMAEGLGWERDPTKTLTYTIQYGGGIKRLVTVFGVSPDHAAAIRQNFYNTYPGFKVQTDNAKALVLHRGKLQLWSKRYRHFVDRSAGAHKGFNSVIQGGAADIVERAMIRLFENVDTEGECEMLLQVHDSVVFRIKKGLESKYLPMIKEQMEGIPEPFGVKFAVDIHKWGSKESWSPE